MKSILEIGSIRRTNLTLSHLRVLAAVLENGGFTAAAQSLGLTQSAASQSLQALEETLGVALLVRRREGVEATEIGGRVLTEARIALTAVERIHEHCADWSGLEHGRLRIGTVPSAAAQLLPDRLHLFKTRYPRIEVSLLEGSDAEVRDWAVRGAIDLGFTAETASELEGEIVAEDDFLVVTSEGNRHGRRKNISISQISNEPFIMSDAGCGLAVRAIFNEAGIAPPVAFSVREMTTLFEMVRQDLGVTIVPELALPRDRSGLRIVRLEPQRRRQLLMVRLRESYVSPSMTIFATLFR